MTAVTKDQGAVEMRLLDALYRLNKSVLGAARTHVAAVAKLDLVDFLILRSIELGIDGPGDLVRDLGLHASVVSRAVTKLVKAGLLTRTIDSSDSRRSYLTLTPAAEKAISEVEERVRPMLHDRLERLTAHQINTLLECFDILNIAS
ncbi:MarR family transcriptional regulator [Mycobacteroides abscessus subsp. abscessus]|uniref:MarR family winged helix-turn-helix transcriptional regulator n=1 Tax=Mycobacteroides abscessus TaxID=36809 RepID=UPI000928F5E0|nr:MarR family transcriptional regulator [Mycobacteroides abscessus]RIR83241.1 MarR family transcriptional regulator [Mycobacteroides abscessus]RIS00217.1 MarR family transcriptional regulator [Mycobacteroides abscessus]RIT66954.1 MarR family transcriptional regulator [Mycobacteroides abscessus]SHR23875.1 MarR family transcriptional regulator [Mycobacteroides abscessus subsp. abscessus]SHS58103.1 MarR family transcriptional regulator [Mycobacteroides abscessus subsp. abscessus]